MKRKTLRPAALALGMAMAMVVGSPAWGQEQMAIDFEDHPANPSGTTGIDLDPHFYEERGVLFGSGATVLRYEPGFTSSGVNGLEMCYSQEFCTTPFTLSFNTPQQAVGIGVGYSGGLDETVGVLMVGFDEFGARVAADEVALGPGAPVPVGTELVIEDPEGRIASVEIRWSDTSRFMNSLVIDDLRFVSFVPQLELVADPSPLVVETADPTVVEMVITNTGNVDVAFFVTIDEASEAFRLLDTTCLEGLAAGDSCALQVSFDPAEPGEFETEAILRDTEGSPIFAVPLFGRRPSIEVTTTTLSATTTIPQSTTVVTPDEESEDDTTGDDTTGDDTTEDDVSGTNLGLILVVATVIGGGGYLIGRLRPPRGPRPTVKVTPREAVEEISESDRGPVTAIRISADADTTTTIITEEETP